MRSADGAIAATIAGEFGHLTGNRNTDQGTAPDARNGNADVTIVKRARRVRIREGHGRLNDPLAGPFDGHQ